MRTDAAAAGSSGNAANAGPLYEEATAQLTQIRARVTVDPGMADATDLDAQTSWWPVQATATFRTTPAGVDLTLTLNQCRKPYAYPVVLYAGSDCSAVQRGSQPWDSTRGVVASKVYCFGDPAHLYETRVSTDPKPWTIGGAADSNLVGRTIAVLDPDTQEPLACGTIQLSNGGALASTRPLPELRPEVVAQMAGLCVLGQVKSAPGACPDLTKVAPCALDHCLADCIDGCMDYAACLQGASQTCSTECQPSADCQSCLGASTLCMLGYCQDEISCAPAPTPGGPCTELRACCTRQGPLVESCNQYATIMERLGGDSSCNGALYDWDVNTHYTYRSPCYPDGGVPMQ